MRFFTPERYLCLGNLKDDRLSRRLRRNGSKPSSNIRPIWARLAANCPQVLRRLIGSVYLHDAVVLDMWRDRGSQLTITLRPESDPARLVVLAYALDKPPQVRRGVLPAERCSEPVAWLYDELDIRPSRPGSRPRFQQRILLSNGWEIRLQFHAVRVARPEAIIPLTQSA